MYNYVERFRVGTINTERTDYNIYLINLHGGHTVFNGTKDKFRDDGHNSVSRMAQASLDAKIISAKIGHNTADYKPYQTVFDGGGMGKFTLKGVEWACWNSINTYGEIITILKPDDPLLLKTMEGATNLWRKKLEKSKPGPEELIDFLSEKFGSNMGDDLLFYQPHLIFADRDPFFGLMMKMLSRVHKVFPYEANTSDHLNISRIGELFQAGEDLNGQLPGEINWESVQKRNNEFPELAPMGGSDSHAIQDIDLAATMIAVEGDLTRENLIKAIQKKRTFPVSGIGERSLTHYPLVRAAFISFAPNSRYFPVLKKWMAPRPRAVFETAQKAVIKWGKTLFTEGMQRKGWVYLDRNGQPQLAQDHFNFDKSQSLQQE